MTAVDHLLAVEGLTVGFPGAALPTVEDVSFALERGQVLGLVGESGSGKTTVALSLLGHRAWGARLGGRVNFQGRDVLSLAQADLERLRGRSISYVPQNPTTALNPARTVGSLLSEFLIVHGAAPTSRAALEIAAAALEEFDFTEPTRILARYPHQLSGGQQQRIVLVLATVCTPAIMVLDEPTTGLDVKTQKSVLTLLAKLKADRQTAMVYVTHDLNVLKEIATHIGVLYAGRLVESGPIETVFGTPRHPYTRALLASRPNLRHPTLERSGLSGTLQRDELGAGCPFAPRCDQAVPACNLNRQVLTAAGNGHLVACERWGEAPPRRPVNPRPLRVVAASEPFLAIDELRVSYRRSSLLGLSRAELAPAVEGASLSVYRGEVVAVVGESGSGKSTLAKAIAGLVPARSGNIRLAGELLAADVARRSPQQRRRMQLVFQNPDASLNPRRRIGAILADALGSFEHLAAAETARRIARSLAEVKLPESYAARFPDQLSGGERQRVAIARALIVDPELLICDEILSALDVSVQAGILDLLRDLCHSRKLAVLFISHDLAVVRMIAQRIAVLYRGQFVAFTTSAKLLSPPLHPYVHQLIAAIPGETVLRPAPPADGSISVAPGGCAFAPQCAVRIDHLCASHPPPWQGEGVRLSCHQSPEGLTAACGIVEEEQLDRDLDSNLDTLPRRLRAP